MMGAYGENKTYLQEANDSRAALGLAIVASIAVLLMGAIMVALWLFH